MENLTENQLEIYNEILNNLQPCPNCKSKENVQKFINGRPSKDLIEVKEKTNICILAGCVMKPGMKGMYCKKCDKEF